MKMVILSLATSMVAFACAPQKHDDSSIIQSVREHLKAVHMDDRIEEHYAGGDIGSYLSQFAWSDNAIVTASDEFQPFIDLFDSLRATANNRDLSSHSPITNGEITLIFYEAFPDENPFGDVEETPLALNKFYELLELYRGRHPTRPQEGPATTTN